MRKVVSNTTLKNMIDINDVDIDLVEQKIGRFYRKNGNVENVIGRLFAKANNSDFDDVFCRVACIDSIYSTQIQRFNKGGIFVVARHLYNNASYIDEVIKSGRINFELYDKLVDVDYRGVQSETGTEKKIYSFASKYLSFSAPEVYPIMDSRVKKAMNCYDDMPYKEFYDSIKNFKDKCNEKLGIDLSFKQVDMFLWQWEKDTEKTAVVVSETKVTNEENEMEACVFPNSDVRI